MVNKKQVETKVSISLNIKAIQAKFDNTFFKGNYMLVSYFRFVVEIPAVESL